jgi:amino-acid N-acetyltransferase
MSDKNIQFVTWLREVAPYIHKHKNKTIVIGFDGNLVRHKALDSLIQDIALLQAMGLRIVLVHGLRPQIEEQLVLRNMQSSFVNNIRVTDAIALECAKEAAGELRLDIEASFSQGLPNTPMAGARISVVSGNFITARPVGIINGHDYQHTGIVRKVDAESINQLLDSHKIILLSPLGFSPTGHAFNLTMEDVATQVSIAIKADKLIFITEFNGLHDENNELIIDLSIDAAIDFLHNINSTYSNAHSNSNKANEYEYVSKATKALNGGVDRVHIIPYSIDGAILLELFLHDGVGTMITNRDLEYLREANLDDIGAILQLIEPLEKDGTLVPRGRGIIERDIRCFSVIEHDGMIFGCAALHLFPEHKIAEMACLTVLPESQGLGDGERLLKHLEKKARRQGIDKLFALTTRTEHWFLKRGFVHASIDDLPPERKKQYNWNRKSMVLIKKL